MSRRMVPALATAGLLFLSGCTGASGDDSAQNTCEKLDAWSTKVNQGSITDDAARDQAVSFAEEFRDIRDNAGDSTMHEALNKIDGLADLFDDFADGKFKVDADPTEYLASLMSDEFNEGVETIKETCGDDISL